MNPLINKTTNVLCVSGHDPSGGAGIQADIEAINSCAAHALSIISCTTVQDSQQVYNVIPNDPHVLQKQISILIKDSPINAIKVGLIANKETIDILAALLIQLKTVDPLVNVPLILDPVFSSGGNNQSLTKADLIAYLKQQLLPLVSIITPNTHELIQLTGETNPDKAAQLVINLGVKWVLLTGTHDTNTKDVINTLYGKNTKQQWNWPRLNGDYHGSGCTLAASLSAFIAQGVDENEAFYLAQQFTWQSLNGAYRSGKGQLTPNRIKQC